jgi:hypothetical protein
MVLFENSKQGGVIFDRYQTAPAEIVEVDHLIAGTTRPALGTSVGPLDVVAQAGSTGASHAHLHVSVQDKMDQGTFVTVPIVFSNYEVSRDFGRSWQSVAVGMPHWGEWVRRPASTQAIGDPWCAAARTKLQRLLDGCG